MDAEDAEDTEEDDEYDEEKYSAHVSRASFNLGSVKRIEVTLGDSPEKEELSQADVSQDTPEDQSIDTESEWLTDDNITDGEDTGNEWEEDSDFYYTAPLTPNLPPSTVNIPNNQVDPDADDHPADEPTPEVEGAAGGAVPWRRVSLAKLKCIEGPTQHRVCVPEDPEARPLTEEEFNRIMTMISGGVDDSGEEEWDNIEAMDLEATDLSEREWEELYKTFDMPEPLASTPVEDAITDTNEFLADPHLYQSNKVRAELDDKKNEKIMGKAEEEDLCEELSCISVNDTPRREAEEDKKIVEEIWGAVGQLDNTECECSWCSDVRDHTLPPKGFSFQLRSVSTCSNEMVRRLGAPTPMIPIKICGGRCLKKRKDAQVCPDSGATTDLISEAVAKKVGMNIEPN